MNSLPSLDAHAHIALHQPVNKLQQVGYVLAMTLSRSEAEQALKRSDPNVLWGVGCYPRSEKAQAVFDPGEFREMIDWTPIVGEIGLDTGSRVPIEVQVQNFRQILQIVAEKPRLVSIHSYRATSLVIDELRRIPISTPILHWWTGSAAETSLAVELGCYFSVHSAIARQSNFRTRVPPERILVESDHGYNDPPAAIPCRVEWVEHLLAQQYRMDVTDVRRLVWKNFSIIIHHNNLQDLISPAFQEINWEISKTPLDRYQQLEF